MIKGEGNRRRVCKSCGKSKRANEGYIVGVNFVCGVDCAFSLSSAALRRVREKSNQKERKAKREKVRAENARLRQRKKELRPIKWWYDELQKAVNYYVVNVRDKDKPCCTCGTTNPDIKYDAGHYRSRGSCPELRFELKNIHKQCSLQCNVYGSGKRAEYRDFIEHVYGRETLDWLDGRHQTLKSQFPHWSDIEKEIKRYRELAK